MIYVKPPRPAVTRAVTGKARPEPPAGASWLARWRQALLGAVVAVAAVGSPGAWAQPVEGQPQQLPTIALTAGFHRIVAMVADSPAERSHGLMWRREMGANEGMLFVFDTPTPQCFWMKNTLIPLAIAFLADDGTIVNIAEMKPQTTDSHCSARPVRFALEMNAGWFGRKGLKAGDRLAGAPFGGGR
jgi:uncharacterized membrane protein (UPF0127 family)